MELLRELQRMGKTILISSHILSELHNLCDMVVIIEHGRLAYSGTVTQASAVIREGRHFLELAILGDAEVALPIVKALPGVLDVRRQGQRLYVEHQVETLSADLIEGCLKQGLRLEEARRSAANLEEIFMSLTKG
jgi:ABC-2 type transport system ATP-binding protein